MPELEKGYVQIYTGNGKGKTTAALGITVRAAGNGLKVFIAHFMKNYPYGELNILKTFPELITIKQFGNDDFVFKNQKPGTKLLQTISTGLEISEKEMLSGKYDIIILDEICVTIFFGLITKEEVIKFVEKKPVNVELVLTGRYCPEELLNKADLITEMKEVKHYYTKGITARKGIES